MNKTILQIVCIALILEVVSKRWHNLIYILDFSRFDLTD